MCFPNLKPVKNNIKILGMYLLGLTPL